jgi:hypothetical protein
LERSNAAFAAFELWCVIERMVLALATASRLARSGATAAANAAAFFM